MYLLHSSGIPKQSGGLIEVITSLDKNSSMGARPLSKVWFAVIKEKIGFEHFSSQTQMIFSFRENLVKQIEGWSQFFLNFML